MKTALQDEVIIVHSSDLHLGADSGDSPSPGGALPVLGGVLGLAQTVGAELLILAGDTFENNRLPSALLSRAAGMMGDFGAPIVILPGNHDPLTPDSVFRRGGLADVANVYILGLTVEEAVTFPGLGLEVWGRAHLDYSDMSPLDRTRLRVTRWQIAVAHGHYVEETKKPDRLLGSWLIRRENMIAAGSDYIALGHWGHAARVGGPGVNAYYSGSPDNGGTVNLVRLRPDGVVAVTGIPVTSGSL